MADTLLAYEDVEVSWDGVPVVGGVSFDVGPGEVVCLVGESGSGKSTLVSAGMGLIRPRGQVTHGDIVYAGRSIVSMGVSELRALAGAELALVSQDSLSSFMPLRRIGVQVFEGLSAHRALTRAASDERAIDLFEHLGLTDARRVLDSYPFELSGGMGQRVGIALALLSRPRVLFADEPTSALDVIAQARVVELLREAVSEVGCAMVIVTHNMGVVRALADTLVVLRAGRVVEQGPAGRVLDAPEHPYTAELIRATPRIDRGGNA